MSEMAEVITNYDALVARALIIVGGAPHWQFIPEPEFACLSVDGDVATLRWPEHASDGYGWEGIERNSIEFETRLLQLDEQALAEWKAEKDAEYRQQQAAKAAAAWRAYEDQERAALAALKAKYPDA